MNPCNVRGKECPGKRFKSCSDECRRKLKVRGAKIRETKLKSKTCPICIGTLPESTAYNKIYCSYECYREGNRRIQRAYSASHKPIKKHSENGAWCDHS